MSPLALAVLFHRVMEWLPMVVLCAVCLVTGYIVGYERAPKVVFASAYLDRALEMAPGTSMHEIDLHEGCLVRMHRDQTGQVVVMYDC